MARDLSSPLAASVLDDDKPKKKKIKKKDRKKMAKAVSSGRAADLKYTMPVPGSVKGDAMTVKKKKYKGQLTATQKKRIANLEKRDEKAEKRNPNFKYNRAKIKKEKLKEKNLKKYTAKKQKAKSKAEFDALSPAAKKRATETSRQQNKITLFKKKNPQNKKKKVGSGCGPGKLYNKKSCSAKNRGRIN